MARGRKTGGRARGTPNSLSADAKAEVLACYAAIGGREQFRRWAEDNQTEFYKLFARLLPKNVQGRVEITDNRSREEVEARVAEKLERLRAQDSDQSTIH